MNSVGSNDAPFSENDSEETDIVDEPPSIRACDKIVTELLNFALFLRRIIMSMKNAVPGVPLAADPCPNKVNATISPYNLMVWLIYVCADEDSSISIDKRVPSSEDCHYQVFLCLAVSCAP